MSAEVEVVAIGLDAAGDGVAVDPSAPDGARHTLPGLLPGERARIVLDAAEGGGARLLTLLEASADRVAAPCPHAGLCGGCTLQHLSADAQAAWKRDRLVHALARKGLEPPVTATIVAPEASRRRVRFAARRTKRGVEIGFYIRRSDRITPIDHCRIARPALVRALPALARLARLAAPRGREIGLWALDSDSGLDIAVEGAKPLDLALREAAAGWLESESRALEVARLSWNGEALATRRPPQITAGRAVITPPPGAFLQAAAESEAEIAAIALDWLGGARRVADLFCGAGAFALRLAERSEVLAVEADPSLAAALDAAWRATPDLRRVVTLTRDLFRRPLTAPDLATIEGLLFDPPRAGAAAQAAALAELPASAPLRRIVGVSCEPSSFARDAALLAGGGWRLGRVVPIDQFRHSAHVEAVGLFER